MRSCWEREVTQTHSKTQNRKRKAINNNHEQHQTTTLKRQQKQHQHKHNKPSQNKKHKRKTKTKTKTATPPKLLLNPRNCVGAAAKILRRTGRSLGAGLGEGFGGVGVVSRDGRRGSRKGEGNIASPLDIDGNSTRRCGRCPPLHFADGGSWI